MYPKNDLYSKYLLHDQGSWLSPRLPDYSKRYILEMINRAVNCCTDWNSFLDIGASTGHYSIPLLSTFKQGTAVEASFNQKLIDLQKKYKNLTVYTDFIENIAFPHTFNFILLADVFEHIPPSSMPLFLKQLADLQEQGGIIHIITPNPVYCGPASESELYFEKNNAGHHGHYKHYFREELLTLFSESGYSPVFYSYHDGWLRSRFTRYLFSLSIKDNHYRSNRIYKTASAPLLWLCRQAAKTIAWLVYRQEKSNRYNEFDTISLSIAFKKQ